MPPEPSIKRAAVFIDGQNLFHSVRAAFGYTYPNYDVLALSRSLCAAADWTLIQARFYTGMPSRALFATETRRFGCQVGQPRRS